jgi:transposase
MRMRGTDVQQGGMFSYVSLEDRVPPEHPLRGVRKLLDEALGGMSREFDRVDAEAGRASIPPERLVRALTLQILYSIRSERLLCEQLDYNLLYRWFVGLTVDEAVMAHVLMDHRHGLPVDVEITDATGYAERQAALKMLDRLPERTGRRTVAGDKAYDTADFVEGCRERGITPHVACNEGRRGGSALDGRTTWHAGYRVSQRIRKRIEEGFGWGKDGRPLRKMKVTGRAKVRFMATLTVSCYALLRVAKLLRPPAMAPA